MIAKLRGILIRTWNEAKSFSCFATHERTIFFDIAKQYLQKCHTILDVGSGSGAFLKSFGKEDIYTLEANQISALNLKSFSKNVVRAEIPFIPFKDKSFDGIHLSHILEHLYHNEVYQTLNETDRTLKDGGILIISGPMLWDGFYKDLSHVKPYDPTIFQNYFVGNRSTKSTTYLRIGNYKTIYLSYRYALQSLSPIIILNFHIVNFFSYAFVTFLKKIGIGHPHRTGFTIVLRKGH